jgi:hypothetical protein
MVENFYYCPHRSRIPIVSYSNTLQSTDSNGVLTVCGWWLLHIELNTQILGVDATRFLLVDLLTKCRLPKIATAHKELIILNGHSPKHPYPPTRHYITPAFLFSSIVGDFIVNPQGYGGQERICCLEVSVFRGGCSMFCNCHWSTTMAIGLWS